MSGILWEYQTSVSPTARCMLHEREQIHQVYCPHADEHRCIMKDRICCFAFLVFLYHQLNVCVFTGEERTGKDHCLHPK